MFESGQAMLTQGDFEGALRAFKAAGRMDSQNEQYVQQFAMLRQVITMRADLEKQTDAEQWMKTAQALRTYYHDHMIYGEALALDQSLHQKSPSANTAVRVAETMLAMGNAGEAEAILLKQSATETTPRLNAMLALALARQGKIAEAATWVKKAPVTNDATAPFLYDLARACALIGDGEAACSALTKSFETTPPSRLEAAKAKAKTCPDLAGIANGEGFATAMTAASKVKESGCSGGTSCGKCPSRAGCSGGDKAKAGEAGKAGEPCKSNEAGQSGQEGAAGHEPCTGK
jgi:tetratricopeptide (TPR) repeat protein